MILPGNRTERDTELNVILVEERLLSMECLAFCTCGIKYGEALDLEQRGRQTMRRIQAHDGEHSTTETTTVSGELDYGVMEGHEDLIFKLC